MHLVRPFYQGFPGEPILWTAIAIHGAIGIKKAYERSQRQQQRQTQAAVQEPTEEENKKDAYGAPVYVSSKKDKAKPQQQGMMLISDGTGPSLLHRYTGYILAGLIGIHIVGGRVIPWIMLDDPSLVDETYTSLAAYDSPFVYVGSKYFYFILFYYCRFVPYYSLLAAVGAYHYFLGFPYAYRNLKWIKPATAHNVWLQRVAIGVTAVAISSALALCGVYFKIDIPNVAIFREAQDYAKVIDRVLFWLL